MIIISTQIDQDSNQVNEYGSFVIKIQIEKGDTGINVNERSDAIYYSRILFFCF